MILTQPSNLNRHRLTDIVNSAASIYTSLFAQRRQSSLLFAVNELVRSFGNDKSCTQAICLSVEEVILRTAASLQTLSDFDDAPDVVDDAFLLVKTCLKYCPKALAKPFTRLLLWTCLFVGFMSSIVKLVALCLTLRVTCCMLGTRTWLSFLDKYCRRVEGLWCVHY